MRIFSKFRDYYDVVVGQTGFDSSLVYERESKALPFKGNLDDYNNHRAWNSYKPDFRWIIILFCGKEYKCIQVYDSMGKYKYFYTKEEYLEYVKNNHKEYYNKIQKHKGGWLYNKPEYTLFEKQIFTNEEISDLHIKYNSPVLVIDEDHSKYNVWNVIINGEIGKYQFVRVVDVYTAFQEIEMYIGGILGMVKDGKVSIADKDMLPQKGFDQFSFKNPKGKKRGRN